MGFICRRCGSDTLSSVSGFALKGTEWLSVCQQCYDELGGKQAVADFAVHSHLSKWPIEDVAKTMRITPEEAQYRRDHSDEGI